MISHPVRRHWPLLAVLISLLSTGASWAAEPAPAAATTPRVKLERVLACRQAEKEAVLAEKQRINGHLAKVQAFRATLTDTPRDRPALETTEQALVKDREALAKAEERLRLADLHLGMTLRAMKYLPTASREDSLPVAERAKLKIADWVAQLKLPSDDQFDRDWRTQYGFADDAPLQQRLARLVERLHAASPQADPPVTVRILAQPNGHNAAATQSYIYFDRTYLESSPPPSDDELLFVAGHELAHIQLHHVGLGASQDIWQRFEDDWFRKSVEGSHVNYQDAGEYDDAGWRTQMARYLREQEAQADLVGTQQALAAGASPRGIRLAFTRLSFDDLKRRLDPALSRQEPHYAKMLEDHARPDERLKALETALGEKFWERTDLKFSSACPR